MPFDDLIKSRPGIDYPALGEAPGMKAVRPQRLSHAHGTFYHYNNWDFNAAGTIFEQETCKWWLEGDYFG
jgi:CubicO group peptidase (beta-lactamase class C family)